MAYSSILNWIINRDDWVNTVVNGVDYSGIVNMSPYAGYNLPYDIGVKIWESLGGLIAWLINLIFPGNPVSYTLVSDPVTNAMAIILMVVVIFAIGFVVNLTMI